MVEEAKRAVFDIARTRSVGLVEKPNAKTTVMRLEVPGYTNEEFIELMACGSSIHRFTRELEDEGITHSAVIKRHNIKHNVVFI